MWRSAKILTAASLAFVVSIVACYWAGEWPRNTYGYSRLGAVRSALTPDDLAAIKVANQACEGAAFVALGASVVCVASLGALLGRLHRWYRRRGEHPRVVARGFEVIR